MGFPEMSARKAELTNQMSIVQNVGTKFSSGDVVGIDKNDDNHNEINKIYSDSGNTIFENFDFDSNGAIDYARYFDEEGNQFSEIFYSNNPENNEVYKPGLLENIISFFGVDSKREAEIRSQADELSAELPDSIEVPTNVSSENKETKKYWGIG